MAFDINWHKEVTAITTKQDIALGIMKWGDSNSFPQTLINLINQSPLAKPAVDRASKFFRGNGFDGDDLIVGQNGLTIGNVVRVLAEDWAIFNAFALHFNYNVKGEITTIQPIRVAELRFNEFDELNYASKIGYHPDFARNSEIQMTTQNIVTKERIRWFNRYNPNKEVVKAQYEDAGGIDNYLGQILYYTDSGKSSYPIPPLQSCINHVLSDIESSILVRRETATGFISTYLLKTTLHDGDPNLDKLELSVVEAQGARSSHKVVVMSGLSPEDVNGTMLEEIGSGGAGAKVVMESVILTNDLNKKIINGAYLIPPVLAGSDQKNGFSGTDLEDAYYIFNSITQDGRNTIEKTLNNILPHSIFSNKIKSIDIKPLSLMDNPNKPMVNDVPNDAQKKIEKEPSKKVEPTKE